jgi:NADH-quinone oxidoreductase subunit G
MEAAVLNSRLRKAVVHNGLEVGSIGPAADLTYPHAHISDDPAVFAQIASGGYSILLCHFL